MPIQQTLIIIKPDGMRLNLTTKIIERFENADLKVNNMTTMSITTDMAERHYAEHKEKPFFAGLVKMITSAPVDIMIVEGENAITKVRELVGPTDPRKAPPGTIRGDYKAEQIENEDGIIQNIIHASDSPESAAREIKIFFNNESSTS